MSSNGSSAKKNVLILRNMFVAHEDSILCIFRLYMMIIIHLYAFKCLKHKTSEAVKFHLCHTGKLVSSLLDEMTHEIRRLR